MSVVTQPHHLLTLDEWLALPDEEGYRPEVQEGILHMVPPPHFDGGDIRLAIEVLSDGTRRVDRVMKFAEYAEAGIERYWIVDLDEPVTLTAFGLVKDAYEKTAELTGIATLEFDSLRITLDLDALTTARAQRP